MLFRSRGIEGEPGDYTVHLYKERSKAFCGTRKKGLLERRGEAVTTEERIGCLKKYVQESNRIVFFGGAGVSTESGIPDFRSTDGLYHQEWNYPPETILSHSFFVQNTEEFYRFYKKKMLCPDAKPNAAHKKLAQLEEQGKLMAVGTQNIDGLHQLAGSKRVYELH